ncbi:hypothetical protein BLNAU_7294 [Blattamonas nauphoetae]|uniref:Uncharacterized protein n=1 Tax=Blattamonas nauphoetae TaxID=2049346 RepID=A0ABQ9Y1S6_9EUKA|nr:hypothetical protein BLNAU_7294 [Blattamonas nauphoetae]
MNSSTVLLLALVESRLPISHISFQVAIPFQTSPQVSMSGPCVRSQSSSEPQTMTVDWNPPHHRLSDEQNTHLFLHSEIHPLHPTLPHMAKSSLLQFLAVLSSSSIWNDLSQEVLEIHSMMVKLLSNGLSAIRMFLTMTEAVLQCVEIIPLLTRALHSSHPPPPTSERTTRHLPHSGQYLSCISNSCSLHRKSDLNKKSIPSHHPLVLLLFENAGFAANQSFFGSSSFCVVLVLSSSSFAPIVSSESCSPLHSQCKSTACDVRLLLVLFHSSNQLFVFACLVSPSAQTKAVAIPFHSESAMEKRITIPLFSPFRSHQEFLSMISPELICGTIEAWSLGSYFLPHDSHQKDVLCFVRMSNSCCLLFLSLFSLVCASELSLFDVS